MTFKGVKRQYLEKRNDLLIKNREIKKRISYIKKTLIEKGKILRAVYFAILQNKKDYDFCKLYDEIDEHQTILLDYFEQLMKSINSLSLKRTFSNVLVNEKVAFKNLQRYYKKSVKNICNI